MNISKIRENVCNIMNNIGKKREVSEKPITTQSNVTFVTAFINIYDTQLGYKDVAWRFEKFGDIADTGVNICIFVSPDVYDFFTNFLVKYDNIRLMKVMSIEDTFIAKQLMDYGTDGEYTLPDTRNIEKDTMKYLTLINSKIEFMNYVASENPWNSTHFAWIDFSISYVFREKEMSLNYLKILASRTFIKSRFLAIAGCWDDINMGGWDDYYNNNVHWRFCGGFMLGDAESVREMYQLYETYFRVFLQKMRKLVWEVNFWTWMESNEEIGWKPTWYKADHNDSILYVPTHLYVQCLDTYLEKTLYNYPRIENYEPMQASIIELNGGGVSILNTRYVNYWCLDTGRYIIHDPNEKIRTINVMSILDAELMPTCYVVMAESESIGLQTHEERPYHGLEDIRLFDSDGADRANIRFIATNRNYSDNNSNKMIVGEYHYENAEYANCRIVEAPYETWCEKNWIPIMNSVGDEFFVYRWSPQMEIGRINDEGGALEIVRRYNVSAPDFNRVRGSTTFHSVEGGLVGVVHFSEETAPRRYFHLMVMLEEETFRPLRYSDPFIFQHLGIEFCTGFKVDRENKKYVFWISKWDREPAMVKTGFENIPMKYDF